MKKIKLREIFNTPFELYNISKYRAEIMGIAIIFIMLCHNSILFSNGRIQMLHDVLIKQMMQVGVDIFLLLSGMGCVFSMEKDPNVLHFYRKRFNRLFPSYILAVTIYCGVRYVLGAGYSAYEIFQKFSLITFFTEKAYMEWFVAAIIVFYLVTPLLFAVMKKSRVLLGMIAFMVFWISMVISSCRLSVPVENAIFVIRIPIFLTGILIADLVRCKTKMQMGGYSLHKHYHCYLFAIYKYEICCKL
jgi:peptidoglycan/LPS O-acetylase OafA/YrhL